MLDRRRAMLAGLKQSRLPDDYQEVEYLKSPIDSSKDDFGPGTAPYINTTIKPNEQTGMYVEMKDLLLRLDADKNFIGARTTDGARFMINYSNQCVGYGYDAFIPTGSAFDLRAKHIISLNYMSDGLGIFNGQPTSLTPKKFNINAPVWVFGQSSSSMFAPHCYGYKVFGFKLSQGDELIQDFIPCYRKSDGVAGMYDLGGTICPLTNSPFYVNAGAGEFLVGGDV